MHESHIAGNFDFEAGRRLLAEGETVDAIRSLLASVDLEPGNVETYIVLFQAYQSAWEESGDPMVLDQMRKVALAGLKRGPDERQRSFLADGLDRTEEFLIEEQRASAADEAASAALTPEPAKGPRKLPLID